MDKQQEINRVTELLSRWYAKIWLNSAIGYFDINRVAEDIALKILSELYNYKKLKNLNWDTSLNYPAIDLADDEKHVCIQVTSINRYFKIKNTIQSYIDHNLDLKYPKLKFFILNKETKSFKNQIEQFGRITLTNGNYNDLQSNIEIIQNEVNLDLEKEYNLNKSAQLLIKRSTNREKEKIEKRTISFEKRLEKIISIVDRQFISEQEFFDEIEKISGKKDEIINKHLRKHLTKVSIDFNVAEDIITSEKLIRDLILLQSTDHKKFLIILRILEEYFNENNNNLDKYFFWSIETLNQHTNEIKTLDELEKEVIPRYLSSLRNQFLYHTKTFLHENPKEFYEIYFPVSLKLGNEELIFVDSVNIFNNDTIQNGYVTIIGGAGSGKSTMIRHLFLNCLENFSGIPFIIEFRKLNEFKGTLLQYICEHCFNNVIRANSKILNEFFMLNTSIFFLDGFDELYSNNIQNRLSEIEQFINTYENNKFIITSRPGTNIQRFGRFYNTEVMDLNKPQIFDFIKLQVSDEDVVAMIKKNILLPENNNFIHFLKNPLLLSMYILTSTHTPEIPNEKRTFYDNIFKTLYERLDSSIRPGYLRERRSSLKRSSFEDILQSFSFTSYFKGRFEFSNLYIYDVFDKIRQKTGLEYTNEHLLFDLTTGMSILICDDSIYKFPHRSIQEYFTAAFINNLSEIQKISIYKDKLDIVEGSTLDSLMNLWELLLEFDELLFAKHFLLRNLEEIVISDNILDESNHKKIFLELVETFKVELHLGKPNFSMVVQKINISYNCRLNNVLNFLDKKFSGIFILPPENLTPRTRDFYELCNELFSIKLYETNNSIKLYNLLFDIGFVQFILNEYQIILNTMNNLKDDLKLKEKNNLNWIDELL